MIAFIPNQSTDVAFSREVVVPGMLDAEMIAVLAD
jgi:hypothetical protein